MSVPDVSVQQVGKEYRLSGARGASRFWALRDVSLEVEPGRSLGVIGRNGAGKSTLFKLLSGITAPTRGRIVLNGHVAALIEVGSGFHPELTGRENVFLSGSLLGMRRREIAQKLARIVEFAGVEQFIDTPVKWYSSGMYVRLGFAIAAHLEPEILLIDEVLAVGDAAFQSRCLQRIRELTAQGTTSLFISHDLTAIERLCDSAVLLERGEIVARGLPRDVVASYHRRIIAEANNPGGSLAAEANNPGSSIAAAANDPRGSIAAAATSGIALTNITIHDPIAPQAVSFRTGGPLVVSIAYEAVKTLPAIEFEVVYYSADGRTRIAAARTGQRGEPLRVEPPGGSVEFTCASLPLPAGAYYLGALVRDLTAGKTVAWWDGETRLYVQEGSPASEQLQIPHTWRHVHGNVDAPAARASVLSRPVG